MTNGGVWGFEERKFELGYFSGSRGKFNYIVVALQFVTCDKIKGRLKEDKEKKNKHKNEIKGTIGRTNLFFSNTIPSPHRRSLDPLLPPFFFISIQHPHEAIRLQLKITCVIFFVFLLCVIWRFMIIIRRWNIQFKTSISFFFLFLNASQTMSARQTDIKGCG